MERMAKLLVMYVWFLCLWINGKQKQYHKLLTGFTG